MILKERIQAAIQTELEPLGFHWLKSRTIFKRSVDRNTVVRILYDADCFHRGITDVTLCAGAEYRDIEGVLYMLTNESVRKRGHFGFVCRLQWLMPEEESANWDFCFMDTDDDTAFNKKLEKLLWRMKTYLLPYVEKLSDKDSAIVEAAKLDRRGLIFFEGVVPIMYCLWKHDKKAALDYLEEKRLRLLGWVEPWEWELLERYNNGERFGEHNPMSAAIYEKYMNFVSKFKEWLKEQ